MSYGLVLCGSSSWSEHFHTTRSIPSLSSISSALCYKADEIDGEWNGTLHWIYLKLSYPYDSSSAALLLASFYLDISFRKLGNGKEGRRISETCNLWKDGCSCGRSRTFIQPCRERDVPIVLLTPQFSLLTTIAVNSNMLIMWSFWMIIVDILFNYIFNQRNNCSHYGLLAFFRDAWLYDEHHALDWSREKTLIVVLELCTFHTISAFVLNLILFFWSISTCLPRSRQLHRTSAQIC